MKGTQLQSNLITEQRQLLKKIYGQGQNLWKVVIFDTFNREINSSLFKMKDLRENNITLYFHIKDNREQLHGVTAIYLVEPTPDNINLIYSDFEDDLYSSVIIHFSSQPQNHILSSLAKKLAKHKPAALTKIQKIQYSYLGFFTMARNMAVLPDTNEIINLLSILKNKPIFVYGSKEEQKVSFLKERLMMGSIFGKQQELIALKPQTYNIVFFFNRDSDYFPVLHHGISYAGLMESIYKISSNGRRIQRPKEQPIEIDLNDDIWTDRRNLATSELSLDQELSIIRAKKMNQKEKLNELNDYNQRQKRIQTHTEVVLDLIKQASARKLNQYNQCEMEIYRKRVLTNELKKDILVLLETTDNDQDKVRLLLIVLLYCEHISIKEIEEFQEKVPALKKSKLFAEVKSKIQKDSNEGQASMVGGAGKMLKKFSIGLLSNFKSGDKFLATKCIEKISSLKESELKEMGLSMSGIQNIPVDAKIGSIIVYCMGGGCLAEEANLTKFDQRIIYSCDKMIGAHELIS